MTILNEKKMSNGVVLTYVDESREITGDRWLVRLCCSASFPLQVWMEDEINLCGAEKEFVLEQLGRTLRHEFAWECQFVDHSEKDEKMAELIERMDDISAYLSSNDFATKLFNKRITELKTAYAQRKHVKENCGPCEEPKDFSDCFK